MISYESQHSARFSATHWKRARRLLSGVGTGAKVRRYRKHDEHRKVEGACLDATSIRRSKVVMVFITSWFDLWLEHLAPETGPWNVEGACPDATSIRQSNIVMLFITSWFDLWPRASSPWNWTAKGADVDLSYKPLWSDPSRYHLKLDSMKSIRSLAQN